nr:MAG TPA: hypothetical protein [Caudoviricetes sp.]
MSAQLPLEFFGGRIGGAPSLCGKNSVSTGWNKKGPCCNPVLTTTKRFTGERHEPEENISSPF